MAAYVFNRTRNRGLLSVGGADHEGKGQEEDGKMGAPGHEHLQRDRSSLGQSTASRGIGQAASNEHKGMA